MAAITGLLAGGEPYDEVVGKAKKIAKWSLEGRE
jgi:hypothetical protein